MTTHNVVADHAFHVLTGDKVNGLVRAYFDGENDFAGSTFESLRQTSANEITVADLHAVSLLDVRVRPRATRWLVNEGPHRDEVNTLLEELPQPELKIWEIERQELDRGSAAWRLWSILCERQGAKKYLGIGDATAQKLIARKRPRSMPIVDSVLKKQLRIEGSPNVWTEIWDLFQEESIRAVVKDLQSSLDLSEASALRVFDAAIWMQGSGSKSARKVQDKVRFEPDITRTEAHF